MSYIKSALVVVCAVLLYAGFSNFFRETEVPILEDKWWGKGDPVNENHEISSAPIDISNDVIKDLKYRLYNTKPFHPSLDGVKQFYGTHTSMLNNVLDYWKNKYNWTERQQYINQYQHNFVNIRGLKIHFLHIKPKSIIKKSGKKVEVLPLLMVHGWPGSFIEFYGIIPMLTEVREDQDFVFELIIPSLPGFTFSEPSTKPGLSATYIAQIFADLMSILEFDRYYIQGGDWGSEVVQRMSIYYPLRVIGVHANMCYMNTRLSNFRFWIGTYIPGVIYEKDEEQLCNSTANTLKFLIEESGYFHLQATKPDTVGVALRDSPMGLAAYMLEKFSTLTNTEYRNQEDGGLTEKFTMDRLLDNVMLYWTTGCMTSAMRLYSEAFTNRALEFLRLPIKIPSGCARFSNELFLTPRVILEERHTKLVHLTTHKKGGHFAAMEEPELLADDIFMFVNTVEKL